MNSTKSHYEVDLSRILKDLNEVNSFTTSYKNNPKGITRRSFTNEDSKARRWLIKKLEDLNLDVNVDGFGNVTATTKNSGKKVVVGSHLDTIPNGGRYDGILGILSALEALRVIKENTIQLNKRIELVAFTDEEERFYSFLGSYAYTGDLDDIALDKVKDSDGFLLKEEMEKQGFDLKTAVKNSGTNLKEIESFVELHIEQGPLLENKKIDIGVVDKVKGDWRYLITVNGKTDHAGFPMQFREDAYLELNDLLYKAYQKSKEFIDQGLLFTVGKIELSTNLANVAPGEASATIDLRVDDKTILEEMDLFIKQLAKQSNLKIDVEYILKLDPTNLDEKVCNAIEKSCTKLDLSCMRISSGAGHDAQVLATKVPSAMIFVPSVAGRSHCPEELTLDSDIEKGSRVLLETLLSLAQ